MIKNTRRLAYLWTIKVNGYILRIVGANDWFTIIFHEGHGYPLESLVIHKLLDNFSSKEEILQQGKAALRQFLSRGEIDFFEQHLRSKGYEFK